MERPKKRMVGEGRGIGFTYFSAFDLQDLRGSKLMSRHNGTNSLRSNSVPKGVVAHYANTL